MAVESYCLGWQKSLPDFRDYSLESPEVRSMTDRLRPIPSSADEGSGAESLAPYFPEIDDQQQINSSPAQACVDLVEYFDRRALGKTVKLSKLFVYQATQRLLGSLGNSAMDLRSTLKSMSFFGVPYEQYWPYDLEKINDEPAAFLYAFADRFRSIRYVRLDGRNRTGQETLSLAKLLLNAGFPSVF